MSEVSKHKRFTPALNRRMLLLLREWLLSPQRNMPREQALNFARIIEARTKISGDAEDINE